MLYRRDPAGGHVILEGPCWSCYTGGTLLIMLYRRDPAGHVI